MKKLLAFCGIMLLISLFQVNIAFGGDLNTKSDRNSFNHDSAMAVLTYAKAHSFAAPPYHYGGGVFQNKEKRLPLKDGNVDLNYKEYDIYQLVKGVQGVPNIDRGNCRVVIGFKNGAFEKAYYTKDHYGSFTELK